jgi:predicted small lipoprotein YifL
MHARLIRPLALAALIALAACGRSDEAKTALETDPATPAGTATPDASASPNGVASGEPDRSGVLPASFPRDIPIPDGLRASSVQSEHAGSYVALFGGDLSPEDVYRFFSERLVAEGWTIDKANGAGPEYGLFASKDDRITTVICTRIDGRLHVELGVNGGS